MTDLKTGVGKLDERVTSLERQVSNTMIKVDMLVEEMRDRDNQRAEDIREIRSSINSMGKHIRNLVITSMTAIGVMVVTVIASLLLN